MLPINLNPDVWVFNPTPYQALNTDVVILTETLIPM